MTQPEFGPYSDVQRYVKTPPAWVPPKDQARVASYAVRREIYWLHVNETFKVMNRGLDKDDSPVYVPSSRIVIDTMNRYVGANLTYAMAQATGTEQSALDAKAALDALFVRERFFSRYAANKRSGLIDGDWGWHLVADPSKPQGSRLSILPMRPDTYFPQYEDEVLEGGDPDKLVAVRLVELVQVGDEQQARVQKYEWNETRTQILSSLSMWKPEEWHLTGEDAKSPIAMVIPPTPLPPQITAMPCYHVPNGDDLDNPPWGSSEIRGLIGLQEALNQSATDEDIALALMGLGVYATEQPGMPTDAQGNPTDWFIYPGAVIQNAKGLHRVEGITTVQPYTDHVSRLEGYLADATGATDAARGRLEVTEAESGVALQFKLAPTLAKAAEKDQIILDVHNQMFYDIVQMWLPAYEQVNITDVTVRATIGDKLPVNRAAEVELMNSMVLGGLISRGTARQYLVSKGFTMFDPREGDLVLAETAAMAAAASGGETEDDARTREEELPEGEVDDDDAA